MVINKAMVGAAPSGGRRTHHSFIYLWLPA